jgi:hypothetical protein
MSGAREVAILTVYKSDSQEIKEYVTFGDNSTIPEILEYAHNVSNEEDNVVIEWFGDEYEECVFIAPKMPINASKVHGTSVRNVFHSTTGNLVDRMAVTWQWLRSKPRENTRIAEIINLVAQKVGNRIEQISQRQVITSGDTQFFHHQEKRIKALLHMMERSGTMKPSDWEVYNASAFQLSMVHNAYVFTTWHKKPEDVIQLLKWVQTNL